MMLVILEFIIIRIEMLILRQVTFALHIICILIFALLESTHGVLYEQPSSLFGKHVYAYSQ